MKIKVLNKIKFAFSKKNIEVFHENMTNNWKPNYWLNIKINEWNEKRLRLETRNYYWANVQFLNISSTIVWKIEIIESTYKSWWNYEKNWT